MDGRDQILGGHADLYAEVFGGVGFVQVVVQVQTDVGDGHPSGKVDLDKVRLADPVTLPVGVRGLVPGWGSTAICTPFGSGSTVRSRTSCLLVKE